MVPSYKTYRAVSAVASRTHAAIKRSNTKAERVLLKSLQKLGVRCRRPSKLLPGNPDFILYRKKVAVFCDGDFWHGKDWTIRRKKLLAGHNPGYWVPKIEYNRRRDRRNNCLLRKEGWKVIRLWESDICKSPLAVARIIVRQL